MNAPSPFSVEKNNTEMRHVEFPLSPSIIPGVMRIVEISSLTILFYVCFSIDNVIFFENRDKYIFSSIFISTAYMLLANYAKLFSVSAIMRPMAVAEQLVVALVTASLFYYAVAASLDALIYFSTSTIASQIFGGFATIIAIRFTAQYALRALSTRQIIGQNMVVLGVGEQSRRFLKRFENTRPYFTSLLGVFSERPISGIDDRFENLPILGDSETLMRYARERKIDEVVVAMPWSADRRLAETIDRLKELPINVHLSTDLAGYDLSLRPVLGPLTELPVFEVIQRPISGWSSALKLIEDYVIASLLLILIAPLMALIAVAIKLDSPGPVFFMQKRLGFNNQVFLIYKFRSMHHHATSETRVRQASRGDPRVTRVGRIIRSTSLDELPQLLNVLNGTMSLVGPRPHALSHNEEYGRRIRGYFARHKVKPGITGWAQVNGLRGETETLEKMEARIRHDIHYAENWSLFFDIKILVMTALVVLFQKTAY